MGPGLPGYLGQEKERMVGRKPAAAWVLCGGRFCHAAARVVLRNGGKKIESFLRFS